MGREQRSDREEPLLVEPIPRNTAAAVALAVAQADADTLLLVMPSDQVIADVPAFHAAIAKGVRLAQQDWIVTFGITPDSPETRSEEHTSELQSLMRISYAVFCLKKKKLKTHISQPNQISTAHISHYRQPTTPAY